MTLVNVIDTVTGHCPPITGMTFAPLLSNQKEAHMLTNGVRVCQADDRIVVQVPYAQADAWHAHFQKMGVHPTLCLDPQAELACLELRGVSAHDVTALLPANV